jgi:hypothetical protein
VTLAGRLALGLVVVSVLIHYEVLYGASRLIPRLSIPIRTRMPVVTAACIVATFWRSVCSLPHTP